MMEHQETNLYALVQKVSEFLAAANHPIKHVGDLETNDYQLWVSLINEEASELSEALNNHNLVNISDGICDLLYVTVGVAVAFSLPLDELFSEVHRSNLTKFGPKADKRSDGKVLKHDGFIPPDLETILRKHSII